MSPEAIFSDGPFFPRTALAGEHAAASRWRDELEAAGHRALIVVPTSRRRRVETRRLAEKRVVLPRLTTLEALVTELSGFCRRQRRLVGAAEQALRMGRALGDCRFPVSPGLVQAALQARSDHFDRDAPPRSGHPLAQPLELFDNGLRKDDVWDGIAQLQQLRDELAEADAPVSRYLQQTYHMALFDGFHHFSKPESALIGNMARGIKVRLWLQGTPGQPWYAETLAAIQQMGIPSDAIHHDTVPPATTLARCGRQFFQEDGHSNNGVPVFLLEVNQKEGEFEEVAREVKRRLRAGDGAAPGQIAVVVSGPSEATRCRLELERAGVPCSAQAERVDLAASRPARLLLAALALRSGRLTHVETVQFLSSPLVRRRLTKSHLFPRLRELGVGHRGCMMPENWATFWKNKISVLQKDANKRRESGETPIEWLADLGELADTAAKSLRRVVSCLDRRDESGGAGPQLAGQVGLLLKELAPEKDLIAEHRPEIIPDREFEEDQLAWNNLKDVLESLRETPDSRFPRHHGKPDMVTALKLALASESFSLRSVDDGRVQILRPLALRGGDFHTVVWVGLNQNEFPSRPAPEETDADERDRLEREQQYFFTQAFEAARHNLLLVRSLRDGDEMLQAGPFWERVVQRLGAQEVDKACPARIDGLIAALATAPESNPADLDEWVKTSREGEILLEQWTRPFLQSVWPAKKPFSATGFEAYAKCPFRFFAEKTLGLSDLSEERLALEWGALLHEGLEKAFAPENAMLPHDEKRLQSALDAVFAAKRSYLDPFHEHQIRRAVKLLTGDKLRVYVQNFRQTGAEVDFEILLGTDCDGIEVWLKGRIDLVAEEENARKIAVFDFKTGPMTKLKDKIETDRLLQPALYALSQGRDGWEVVAGYIVVRKDELRFHGSHNYPALGRTHSFPLNPEKALASALTAAANIRSGRISLTSFGPEKTDTECRSACPVRHACRHPAGYK